MHELVPNELTDDALLSADEQDDLRELEGVIERGQEAFLQVGQALAEIQRDRLYRASYPSFEAYLGERWPKIGLRTGYRMIAAAEVQESLRPIGHTLANESQARVLAPLSPEERRQAVTTAVAATGGAPTAKALAAAAAAIKPPAQFAEVQAQARAAGWTLTMDGGEFVLTPPTGSPIKSSQWPLVQRKVQELAPPPAPAAPAPVVLTPLAPAPVVLTPLPTPGEADLLQLSVVVALCEELLTLAREQLAQAGGTPPAFEVEALVLRTAASLALASPGLRMQVAGLLMQVRS